MAFIGKFRKEDIISLMNELDLTVPVNPTVAKMKQAIIGSKEYNEEFTKSVLNNIVQEREEKLAREREKLDREQQEREREFQLEQLRIQNSGNRLRTDSVVVQNKTDLTKIIKCFDSRDPKADISTYLALFERQATRIEIKKEDFVTHLLGLLPLDIAQIITREPEIVSNDYEHMKAILLKRFGLTPEQFRQKLFTHKKDVNSSWRDFAFEINHYFEEWISGVNVKDFNSLCELVVSDQIKRRVPPEVKEHFIDSWHKWNTRGDVVEKLEEYDAARVSWEKTVSSKVNKEKESVSSPVFWKDKRNFESTRKKCYACHSYSHKIADCKYRFRNDKFERRGEIEPKNVHQMVVETPNKAGGKFRSVRYDDNVSYKNVTDSKAEGQPSTNVRSNKIEKDVTILDVDVKSIFDTGSEVTLINEECYNKIGSSPLFNTNINLCGIGSENVTPIGFFNTKVVIDNCAVFTDIYVVKNLRYSAVIGMDVLSKLELNLSQGKVNVKNAIMIDVVHSNKFVKVNNLNQYLYPTSETQRDLFPFKPQQKSCGLQISKKKENKDVSVIEVLTNRYTNSSTKSREFRREAEEDSLKIQGENKKNWYEKRKESRKYKESDLVAIERTQFGSGLKLRPKSFGSYKIVKVKPKERYDVEKIGLHNGPNATSTAADKMKPWNP